MNSEPTNPQIKLIANPVCQISKEGLELIKQLTACVELVHHENYDREDLIKKLAGCNRLLANTCYEDVTRILDSYKIISPSKPAI